MVLFGVTFLQKCVQPAATTASGHKDLPSHFQSFLSEADLIEFIVAATPERQSAAPAITHCSHTFAPGLRSPLASQLSPRALVLAPAAVSPVFAALATDTVSRAEDAANARAKSRAAVLGETRGSARAGVARKMASKERAKADMAAEHM